MKTKNYLIPVLALALGACSTGKYVSTGYVDDIYFNPQDVPPPVVVEEPVQQDNVRSGSPDRMIISQITKNDEGNQTMNNYIFDGQDANRYADAQRYNLEQMELENSDTTVYYDDNEIKYVINNYYEGDDLDFAYRIHRFHRPFFYGPYSYNSWYWNDWYWNDWYWDSWYYDSWYSPYSYWGMGYSPWYGGMYGGMYGGWYSPYSYYGWGGGWGYPYSGWYSGYYGGWGNYYGSSDDYRYGKRRDYNTTVRGGGGGKYGAFRGSANTNDPSALKSTNRNASGTVVNDPSLRGNSISGAAGGGRPGRTGVGAADNSGNETITNLRRNSSSVSGAASGESSRRYSGSQGQYTRPATSGNSNTQGRVNSYSPSYNQERSGTRSSYNVQSYDRPASSGSQQGAVKSATRSTTVYSRPSSSSGSDRTYRSTSTYNRSSSSGYNSNRSYTPSSSGSSYSSPDRSYSPSYNSSSSGSSGSYSSPSRGSSYSGGSSGGSSGGGGGGSSSGGGGSQSHSGRR